MSRTWSSSSPSSLPPTQLAPAPRQALLTALPSAAAVAIIRLRSLGDALLATPALAALKQFRPDLRLHFLIEPRFADALIGNPDLEQVIPVGKSVAARLAALRRLRAARTQVTVNLHGGSTAAWLTRFSGAPARVTFAGLRHQWAHTHWVPPEPPPADAPRWHTVEHIGSLFRFLGLPGPGQGAPPLGPMRLAVAAVAQARMRQRLATAGLTGRYVFINANPRSATMRWPLERWVELLRWLHARTGWQAVMLEGGAQAEPGLEERLVARLPGIAVALGGTSVADLIATVADAEAFLGSDGGPVHVASALAKPVLAIYSSTDWLVWAPWRTRCEIVRHALPCAPCPSDRCYVFSEPRCILDLPLEQVQAAVVRLLG